MRLSDLFGIALWPLVLFGLWLILKYKPRGVPPMRTPMTFIGGLLVAVPIILLVEYFASQSMGFVFDEYLMIIVTGALVLFGTHRQKQTAWAWPTGALLGILMIGLAGWYMIGDFLLPRSEVQGVANGKHTEYSGKYRLARRYHVDIGGKDYQTTAEIYDRIETGRLIRASIGTGSHVIMGIEIFPNGSRPAL